MTYTRTPTAKSWSTWTGSGAASAWTAGAGRRPPWFVRDWASGEGYPTRCPLTVTTSAQFWWVTCSVLARRPVWLSVNTRSGTKAPSVCTKTTEPASSATHSQVSQTDAGDRLRWYGIPVGVNAGKKHYNQNTFTGLGYSSFTIFDQKEKILKKFGTVFPYIKTLKRPTGFELILLDSQLSLYHIALWC